MKHLVMVISMLSATLVASQAYIQTSQPAAARNIVLVHGAWGRRLQLERGDLAASGSRSACDRRQNPLTSLADSVAATRRALALQNGPTVLVAHSWGLQSVAQAHELVKRQRNFVILDLRQR